MIPVPDDLAIILGDVDPNDQPILTLAITQAQGLLAGRFPSIADATWEEPPPALAAVWRSVAARIAAKWIERAHGVTSYDKLDFEEPITESEAMSIAGWLGPLIPDDDEEDE